MSKFINREKESTKKLFDKNNIRIIWIFKLNWNVQTTFLTVICWRRLAAKVWRCTFLFYAQSYFSEKFACGMQKQKMIIDNTYKNENKFGGNCCSREILVTTPLFKIKFKFILHTFTFQRSYMKWMRLGLEISCLLSERHLCTMIME